MEKIHMGLFSYQVSGATRAREQMAAQELEQKLEFAGRLYHNPYIADDISDIRRAVGKKYGVNIRAVV